MAPHDAHRWIRLCHGNGDSDSNDNGDTNMQAPGPMNAPMNAAQGKRSAAPPSRSEAETNPPRGYAARNLTPDPAETLARWLVTAQTAGSPDQIWQLLQSPNYADLWYGARQAGETIRAQALSWLYTQRPRPGGAHPDPREPAAFSSSAVIAAAARHLSLAWYPVPEPVAQEADTLVGEAQRPLLAWLITYPDQRPPDLAIRATSNVAALHFAAACVLGYYAREAPHLNDRDAPSGLILPPADPLTVPILHQFAKALLGLEEECPREWHCLCNQIRARYNAPPADHPQPTDALDATALRDEVQHHLRQQRPADSLPDLCECR